MGSKYISKSEINYNSKQESLNYISFPINEHAEYISRLNLNKKIYTTRVLKEVDKYKMGQIYSSPFGMLKVIYLKHFKKIDDHPFLTELNYKQKLEIEKYINKTGYDVVGLILI